jgi:hypothetical protein
MGDGRIPRVVYRSTPPQEKSEPVCSSAPISTSAAYGGRESSLSTNIR